MVSYGELKEFDGFFWARLLGRRRKDSSSPWLYAWEEVWIDPYSGGFVEAVPARGCPLPESESDYPAGDFAREMNNFDVSVPTFSAFTSQSDPRPVVWMRFRLDQGGRRIHEFSAGLAPVLRGKMLTPLAPGGSATMRVWASGGGADQDLEVNVVVRAWMLGSRTVAAGKEVVATWFAMDGAFYVTAAEC
jgi:hypothetical protein